MGDEESQPLLASSQASGSQAYAAKYNRTTSLGGTTGTRSAKSFYRQHYEEDDNNGEKGVNPHDKYVTKGNHAHGSMVDSLETVTLSWENVNVYVNAQSRGCCRGPDPSVPTKHVLRDVYGHVVPGTLLAVIGASGSGKTTLLNTLTSRVNNQALNAAGDIRVNGIDVGYGIRNISAYVQQDDMFIATMTVREHLTFRALLRMDQEVTKERRFKRVNDVMSELGLTKCSDNIIGDPGRLKGISGGEMRRLSFASEILTNPPLLFCDEPTSGLDSFMAENIVLTLKDMASKGRTILCTIHQPSSEVFALFDTVMVMAEGRVAFMGDSKEALKFYESVGYPVPVNFNPADFYIKTMAVVPGNEDSCKQRIESICDGFLNSQYTKNIKDDIATACSNPKETGVIFEEAFSSTSRYESPWYVQLSAVFARCLKTTIREPMVIRVKLIQTLMLGIILGLIYLQLDLDQQGVMNINGVLFLFITNVSFTNIFGVLNLIAALLGLIFLDLNVDQEGVMNMNGILFLFVTDVTFQNVMSTAVSFPVEVPIFLREYGIGLYRVDIYFFCKCLAELPGVILIPCIFAGICYWMVGLYSTAEAFFIFVGILVLTANTAVSFGYIVSAAANSVTTALAVAPPLMIPLLMFGGFFLNADSIPKYFIWMEYLSWFKYSNELLALNQWENINNITCPEPMQNMTCNSKCLFPTGDSVISYLNFDADNKQIDYIALTALLVGYRLIAFIVLFAKARRSKN